MAGRSRNVFRVCQLLNHPFRITELTSIRDEDVIDAEDITKILPRFMDFCKGASSGVIMQTR